MTRSDAGRWPAPLTASPSAISTGPLSARSSGPCCSYFLAQNSVWAWRTALDPEGTPVAARIVGAFLTSVPVQRGAGTLACRIGTHADARLRHICHNRAQCRDE